MIPTEGSRTVGSSGKTADSRAVRFRRGFAVAGAAIVLAACGTVSSASSSASAAKSASSVKGKTTAAIGGARHGGLVVGQISQVATSSFTLKANGRPDVLVNYSTTTSFVQRKTVPLASLAVGECVTALGSLNSTGVLTTRFLSVFPASSRGCVRNLRPGFGRRRRKGGTFGSGASFPGRSALPGGGRYTPVTGVIASISGSTLEVQSTSAQTSVTVGPSIIITVTSPATATSLSARQCARVLSSSPVSSTTTAVPARSVTLYAPTAQGCKALRGGFGAASAG